MIAPTTIGAITHARPRRPRYGPSVPTFVVGFRPGGRIVILLRAIGPSVRTDVRSLDTGSRSWGDGASRARGGNRALDPSVTRGHRGRRHIVGGALVAGRIRPTRGSP